MSDTSKRVVVTGMGVVTPLGNDVQTFWEALCSGKDGLGPITTCNLSDFVIQQGGQVKDIHATEFIPFVGWWSLGRPMPDRN